MRLLALIHTWNLNHNDSCCGKNSRCQIRCNFKFQDDYCDSGDPETAPLASLHPYLPSGTRQAPPTMVYSLLPALGRQRHLDLWEFEVSLVYIANSKAAKGYRERLCLMNKQTSKTSNKQWRSSLDLMATWKHWRWSVPKPFLSVKLCYK